MCNNLIQNVSLGFGNVYLNDTYIRPSWAKKKQQTKKQGISRDSREIGRLIPGSDTCRFREKY